MKSIQFRKECQEIVNKIKEKFIDLAPTNIDSDGEDYIDRIQDKQIKFKNDFEIKINDQKNKNLF